MDIPKWEDVRPEGELAYRILKNYTRLEEKEYRPESIFSMDKAGWPGDWEGRTILALVLHSRVTGRKAAFLGAILTRLEEEFNELGYLKEILPEGVVNEQQLSGHNWLLRGLLEYYLWTGDEKAAGWAKRIVENLYLKAAGMYADYPLAPESRSLAGEAAGHVEGVAVNGWFLSTDIGCAYMSMDGLSQYYEIFKDERVAGLLDEMAANFKKIDFAGASMQTHASLSAVRGLMRYYRSTGKKDLLEQAVSFFGFYLEHGMTENYANFNWFGRPLWTEPCAIVDSYLLALDLFAETKRIIYAETAARIYYNALGFAQRPNGGFGCDECVGPDPEKGLLKAQKQNYEAFWCCSMRGAEGLSNAAGRMVFGEKGRIWFVNYFEGIYRMNGAEFHVTGRFPEEGSVDIEVTENIGTKELRLYIPEGTDQKSVRIWEGEEEKQGVWKEGFYTIPVTGCAYLKLRFELKDNDRPAAGSHTPKGWYTRWHGVQLLGKPSGDEKGCLKPVGMSIYKSKEELTETGIQVLFRD